MTGAAGHEGLDRVRRFAALRSWAPEILLVAVTTGAGWWASGQWVTPFGDPGGWWSLLHRLGLGERLYRDVYLQYGPLSPYLLASVGWLFGLSPASFLLMNWVPAILLGVLLLRAARPYLTGWERLSVVGLLLGLGLFAGGSARLILPYSPAAVHALIFSVLALLLLQRDPPLRFDAVAAGIFAGLAFCAKQEIGLVALAAVCFPVGARSSRGRSWFLRALASFCGVAGVGLLVVFGSASVESLKLDSHFWPIGAVPDSWKYLSALTTGWMIRDWHVRLGRAILAFLYVSAMFGLLGLLFGRDSRVRRSLLIVLLCALAIGGATEGVVFGPDLDPLLLSMLAAFGLAAAAYFDRGRPGRDFLMAIGLFTGVIGIRTAFAGNLGWSSYSGITNVATALTWPLFLFLFVPKLFPGGTAAAAATRRLWAFLLLPIALYAGWSGIRELRGDALVQVETRVGRVWGGKTASPLYSELARSLRPGERSLVLPEPNAVEALFDVRGASPYLYCLPGWLDARAEDTLLRRFETDPPDVVVIFVRPTWEFGVEPFGRGFGKRLASWLLRNYRVASRAPGGVILRRMVGT